MHVLLASDQPKASLIHHYKNPVIDQIQRKILLAMPVKVRVEKRKSYHGPQAPATPREIAQRQTFSVNRLNSPC